MNVEIQINNSANPTARYVSWSPSACRIRVTDPTGATGSPANIKLSAKTVPGGGMVRFAATAAGPFTGTLNVAVPTSGATVPFFLAGRFGKPSSSDGDVTIEARKGSTLLGSVKVMVRVRKDAMTLTDAERDRFVAAMAALNNQGIGRFTDFREMHNIPGLSQAHGAPGFLSWHRAYLLDLERELQAIDPSVSLPYWRFERAAPKLFTAEFLGVSDNAGNVSFSFGHPMRFWVTDNQTGILRRPLWDVSTAPPGLRTEAQTLAIGNAFNQFRSMELNPHNPAHTRFGGFISSPSTAPRDPLFFLLHCNVDRLWAIWQKQFGRFDPSLQASFGAGTGNNPGHNLNDTMWPWNGVTGGTRPNNAPGGALASSPCTTAPGNQPRVSDCLDYPGTVNIASRLGFDYDDVSFG